MSEAASFRKMPATVLPRTWDGLLKETNRAVVARGECALNGLRLIHNKMEALLGREHARIDALYFCPHHPDNGFANEVAE